MLFSPESWYGYYLQRRFSRPSFDRKIIKRLTFDNLFQAVRHFSLKPVEKWRRLSRFPTLRSNDAYGNVNVIKTIGLISKKTTLHVHHTLMYISFPFLDDYDVKMRNFAFNGERKQQQRNLISLSELKYGPLKFSFRRVRLQLTK